MRPLRRQAAGDLGCSSGRAPEFAPTRHSGSDSAARAIMCSFSIVLHQAVFAASPQTRGRFVQLRVTVKNINLLPSGVIVGGFAADARAFCAASGYS